MEEVLIQYIFSNLRSLESPPGELKQIQVPLLDTIIMLMEYI